MNHRLNAADTAAHVVLMYVDPDTTENIVIQRKIVSTAASLGILIAMSLVFVAEAVAGDAPVGDFTPPSPNSGDSPTQERPDLPQPGSEDAVPSFAESTAIDYAKLEKEVSELNTADLSEEGLAPDAWKDWHKRVAIAVDARFNQLAVPAFRKSRTLMAAAQYSVTKDGHIVDAKLLHKSWNLLFNKLVLGLIRSVDGDTKLLEFPVGSKREVVVNGCLFTVNYFVGDFPGKNTSGPGSDTKPMTLPNKDSVPLIPTREDKTGH